jgi:hypothetical protein
MTKVRREAVTSDATSWHWFSQVGLPIRPAPELTNWNKSEKLTFRLGTFFALNISYAPISFSGRMTRSTHNDMAGPSGVFGCFDDIYDVDFQSKIVYKLRPVSMLRFPPA